MHACLNHFILSSVFNKRLALLIRNSPVFIIVIKRYYFMGISLIFPVYCNFSSIYSNIFFLNFRVNTYLFNSVTLKFWPRIRRIQNYIHNNLRKVDDCKNRWRCICKSRFSPVDGSGWVIKKYLSFSGGHLFLIISLCKF